MDADSRRKVPGNARRMAIFVLMCVLYAQSLNFLARQLTKIKRLPQRSASIRGSVPSKKAAAIIMNRFTRKFVSLVGITAVLFAQLAVSAYACPLQFMGLDDAVTMVSAHAANSSERAVGSPALCQKHCENGEQNVNDTPQSPVSVLFASAVFAILSLDWIASVPVTITKPALLHATSPPLSICNCCFRI